MGVRHTVTTTFKEIIQTAIVSLGIFFFVYIFLVQPHRVKGESMLPNLLDGELLLTEKVNYRFWDPIRGDVVVFKAPGKNADFIKRIVGLPGENVVIEGGFVYINGNKLNEVYITISTKGEFNKTLGEDEYFMLGDNRGSSFDSRGLGPINKSSFRGRAWLIYWPILKNGKQPGMRIISRVHY